MIVLTRKTLRQFWEKHPQAREPLQTWYTIAEAARWQSIADVKRDFSHADAIDYCTCFNIAGNKYRLIVRIDYAKQKIRVRYVLTHSEYDREPFADECKKKTL